MHVLKSWEVVFLSVEGLHGSIMVTCAESCVLTLSKHPWMSVCPSILHGLIFVLHAVDLMVIHHHPCVTIGSSSWRGALSLGVWPISGPQRGPDGRGVQGLFDQSGLRCGERQAGRSSRTAGRERDGVCQASEQESRAEITASRIQLIKMSRRNWFLNYLLFNWLFSLLWKTSLCTATISIFSLYT